MHAGSDSQAGSAHVIIGNHGTDRRDARAEADVDAKEPQARLEVADRLVELLFSRDELGHVELRVCGGRVDGGFSDWLRMFVLPFRRSSLPNTYLPPDLRLALKERHVVAPLPRRRRERQPRRPRAHHRQPFLLRGGRQVQLRLVPRARVHEARGALALEGVVQAGLTKLCRVRFR